MKKEDRQRREEEDRQRLDVEYIGSSSAQSLICGKPDDERVEDSEESEEEDVDADISSMAGRIDARVIIQRESSDDETIPVLDELDENERELVE